MGNTTRTLDERIEQLQKKQAELKAREKQLKARKSQEERKKRTKRLIETGAVIEKALEIELDTPEKREALLNILLKERPARSGGTYTYAKFFRGEIEKVTDDLLSKLIR